MKLQLPPPPRKSTKIGRYWLRHGNSSTANIYKLMLGVLFLFVTSCQKEELLPAKPETKKYASSIEVNEAGRIKIGSNVEFNEIMAELHQATSLKALTSKVDLLIGTDFYSHLKIGKKVLRPISNPGEGVSDKQMLSTATESNQQELVSDAFFSSLLNDRLEIEVGGVIYKVTPFGTFMIKPEKMERLYQILAAQNIDNQGNVDLFNHRFFRNRENDNIFKVEDDIYLFDTYNLTNPEERVVSRIMPPMEDPTEPSHGGGGNGTPNPPVPEPNYNAFSTYSFGAKTWAGKALEWLRGRDEIHKEYFSNNRRVRVNFYNANYGVYQAIGVSVKMQKKNWIGWSGTDATELRLGWDNISFKIDVPPAPANGTPEDLSNPKTEFPFSDKIWILIPGIPGIHDKETAISGSEIIQYATQNGYEWLESQIGDKAKPGIITWEYGANNNATVHLTKDEMKCSGCEAIEKVFDWQTGIITFGTNGISYEFPDNGFKLLSASVYGAAYFNYDWKGMRVITE